MSEASEWHLGGGGVYAHLYKTVAHSGVLRQELNSHNNVTSADSNSCVVLRTPTATEMSWSMRNLTLLVMRSVPNFCKSVLNDFNSSKITWCSYRGESIWHSPSRNPIWCVSNEHTSGPYSLSEILEEANQISVVGQIKCLEGKMYPSPPPF